MTPSVTCHALPRWALTTTAPDVAQLGQVQDATVGSATDAVGLDAVTDTARSVVPASALPDTSALNLGR
ncbi:hypothetical protein ACWDTQ_31090 [Streptomyces cellulosae]